MGTPGAQAQMGKSARGIKIETLLYGERGTGVSFIAFKPS